MRAGVPRFLLPQPVGGARSPGLLVGNPGTRRRPVQRFSGRHSSLPGHSPSPPLPPAPCSFLNPKRSDKTGTGHHTAVISEALGSQRETFEGQWRRQPRPLPSRDPACDAKFVQRCPAGNTVKPSFKTKDIFLPEQEEMLFKDNKCYHLSHCILNRNY